MPMAEERLIDPSLCNPFSLPLSLSLSSHCDAALGRYGLLSQFNQLSTGPQGTGAAIAT